MAYSHGVGEEERSARKWRKNWATGKGRWREARARVPPLPSPHLSLLRPEAHCDTILYIL